MTTPPKTRPKKNTNERTTNKIRTNFELSTQKPTNTLGRLLVESYRPRETLAKPSQDLPHPHKTLPHPPAAGRGAFLPGRGGVAASPASRGLTLRTMVRPLRGMHPPRPAPLALAISLARGAYPPHASAPRSRVIAARLGEATAPWAHPRLVGRASPRARAAGGVNRPFGRRPHGYPPPWGRGFCPAAISAGEPLADIADECRGC